MSEYVDPFADELSERGGATSEDESAAPPTGIAGTPSSDRADSGSRSLHAPRSESIIRTKADVPAELERVKKGKTRNVDLEWLLRRAGKK